MEGRIELPKYTDALIYKYITLHAEGVFADAIKSRKLIWGNDLQSQVSLQGTREGQSHSRNMKNKAEVDMIPQIEKYKNLEKLGK
jgi:hypothetical protein